MLKFGNKEFRNLQEQVEKNMKDILFILQEEGVLNEFGIKVVGQEASAASMPSVEDYKEAHEDWSYGDTYAIGTTQPYTLYVLTRANGTHPNDYWFNIGSFPAPGPVGPQGPQGEVGPQGQTGNTGPQGESAGFGTVTATATSVEPEEEASASVVVSGPNTALNLDFSFEIPKGEKGDTAYAEWGNIDGNIDNQTDLVNALQLKQNASNAVTTDGTQTISGVKTINSELKFVDSTGTSATVNSIKTNQYGGFQILRDNGVAFTIGGSDIRFSNKHFLPAGGNTIYSIGSSTSLWKDLYLSGDLTDGTNSISIADIASKSEIPTNYVTTDTAQTISGDKTVAYGNKTSYTLNNGNTFGLSGNQYNYLQIDYNGAGMYSFGTAQFFPNSNNARDLGTSSLNWRNLYLAGNAYLGNTDHYIKKGSGNVVEIGANGTTILTLGSSSSAFNSVLRASGDNQKDLGQSGVRWKDLYLSGKLRDGTNSISIADIASKDEIPTATSELTNDSGFITGITSSDVTTALGYTPGTSNFSGAYADLTGKPTIPTKTSDLTNDSGFITSSALSGYATQSYVQGYHDSTKQDVISDLSTIRSGAALGATAVQPGDLATVATTGSYDDLDDLPTIPSISANPTTTTDSLTGLTIDGTSYAITASTEKIYRHRLDIKVGTAPFYQDYYIDWFNKISTNTSPTTVRALVQALGTSVLPAMISATGLAPSAISFPATVSMSATSLNVYYISGSGSITSYEVTNTILTDSATTFTTTVLAG